MSVQSFFIFTLATTLRHAFVNLFSFWLYILCTYTSNVLTLRLHNSINYIFESFTGEPYKPRSFQDSRHLRAVLFTADDFWIFEDAKGALAGRRPCNDKHVQKMKIMNSKSRQSLIILWTFKKPSWNKITSFLGDINMLCPIFIFNPLLFYNSNVIVIFIGITGRISLFMSWARLLFRFLQVNRGAVSSLGVSREDGRFLDFFKVEYIPILKFRW